jgi:hypothetical protein
MPTSSKVIELRQLLSERFAGAQAVRGKTADVFATGIDCLDDVGLPKGAITEFVCPHLSGGTATLLSLLLESATQSGYFVALVDSHDSFDPQSAGQAACERLLWVRCRNADESVKSADLLLRDGNIPIVILDLRLASTRELNSIGSPAWYRLQTLVHKTSGLFLAFTPKTTVSSARLRVHLESAVTLDDLQRSPQSLVAKMQLRVSRRRIKPDREQQPYAASGF